ncbi:MAG: cell division protein FtsX [Nitritalea sp.]
MRTKARKKTRLGRFKFLSVLFSTTLSLFIVGLFGLIIIQAKVLSSLIRENVEVQVFLKKGLSEQQYAQVQQRIASQPYVLKREGEALIHFTTEEEAAEKFLADTGEDFMQFLDDNPLRASISFSVAEEFQTADQLAEISASLEKMEEVFETSYMNDLLEAINQNMVKVSLVMAGFVLILVLTVIMLIHNTIKLALFSQRFLIRSMQLVGATRGFIRKPFLARSFVYGAIAGGISSLLLYGLILYTQQQIDGFSLLSELNLLLGLFGGLVLAGALLSFFSTLSAVNKYLNMSLDELY